MELWNRRDIRPPPNISVKVKKGTVDVKKLKAILRDALKILKFNYTLHQEAAIFSRYLYKTKRTLGSHKQFEYMAKVKQGLQRYISLNLDVVYKNFYSIISSDEGVDMFDEWIYVPSKQMLEYVLARTQGFCKVMFYVMVACQNSAPHLKCVLQIGHNVANSLMGLSLISRIWYCSKYYVMCTFQWYSRLLPYLKTLEISGLPWLPEGYEFPDNLGTWLGPDPLTGETMSCVADVQEISNEIVKKYNETDVGVAVDRKAFKRMHCNSKYDKLLMSAEDSPVHSPKRLNETPKEIVQKTFKSSNLSEDRSQDIGEVISREEYPSVKHKDRGVLVENVDSPPEMDCSSSKQMKFGSAESLILETSIASPSEFHDTSLNVNPKSKTVQLFMASMSQISNNNKKLKGARRGRDSVAKGALKHCMGNGKKEENSVEIALPRLQHSEESSKQLEMKSIGELHSPKSTRHPVLDSAIKFPVEKSKSLQKINGRSDSINDETPISLSDNEQEKSMCDTKNLSISKKNTSLGVKSSSSMENNSEVSKRIISKQKLAPKKKGKVKENVEIINEIRTVNDVKVFLHAEKKARAKGKTSVTSQLSAGDWKILVETIKKDIRKTSFLKLKGKRQTKSVMEDIRSTLMSFI